ncbi:hypothetical protein JVT61DRAFT_15452 [Boletus reticuloceps]|uniref:Uncharacterized protein n=1 Tax=Boletus reticuloceps TaxID=495285 RepID=A0A8I3AA62_9AGAM|nr:hypothetical protein JVT61DRAFT_15452 [Boletus reticuloceps]
MLKKSWHSPIYSFFKLDAVKVEYVDGRLVHFFPCAAGKCKNSVGGVRHYQDSKDRASTANLKHHAVACWGKEAVDNTCSGDIPQGPTGSIYAAFARQGELGTKQPVYHTQRALSNDEMRYDKSYFILQY